MPRKAFIVEQIIQHLFEAEVGLAHGQNIAQVCKKIGITDQTQYRGQKERDGTPIGQAIWLKLTHDCVDEPH